MKDLFMTDLFWKTAGMSLSASWIVLAVLAVRLALKKAPKWMLCGLWALVAIRLLCPFSLESSLSLIPAPQAIPIQWQQALLTDPEPGDILAVHAEPTQVTKDGVSKPGEAFVYMAVPTFDGSVKTAGPIPQNNVWMLILGHAPYIWGFGVILLLVYAAVTYLYIRRKVSVSLEAEKGVYICDALGTPFILGILRPKIYLPSAMAPEDAGHVLAHERAHLKRKDHWWKPLGFLLLSVHWFNPLLWVAYILLCRDIEMACDERVVKDMGAPEKKAYSEALLNCSLPRHLIAACPLAFGEVGVKQRVKSVLHYKKPGFWILLVSTLAITIVAVCFLTDPVQVELESPFEKELWVSDVVYSRKGGKMKNIPSDLLDTITLSDTQDTSFAIQGHFEPVTLTESNFDAYMPDTGSWTGTSARKLRNKTVNAWVLHDTFLSHGNYDNSHEFYYLLQTKDGGLYLTDGWYWNAQVKPGATYINWVLKLEDALATRPFTDGDNPFLYTRTIRPQYLDYASDFIVTTYDTDGSQKQYEVNTSTVADLLCSIPQEDFTLGAPIQDVEASLHVDAQSGDIFDITLRYGEGKVDMVFDASSTFGFTKTGPQAWVIQNEDLNDFFCKFSRNFILPEALEKMDDPYAWCQSITTELLDSLRVFVFSSENLNQGYICGEIQAQNLLSALKKLPASAFVPSGFDTGNYVPHNGGSMLLSCKMPADSDYVHNAGIIYTDGAVYFSLERYHYITREMQSLTWEILDEEFCSYQAAYYDPLEPRDFLAMEASLDTVTVSHDYANITLSVLDYMEYEVVEYTDDATPFGIRFRPKAVDEGWIFLAFFPNGFTPEPNWESSSPGVRSDLYTFQSYYQVIGGISYPRATHYNNLAGDYAVIYEDADRWSMEYYDEISYLGAWGEENDAASGYLTKAQILDIARPLLLDSLSQRITLQAGGKAREVLASFGFHTGIWTFATEAAEDCESIVVLRLDAQGNVIP